ncbi:MAG TPA: hypothetical protein DDZ67_10235, partial [Xanthomonadaceae bacterium]|nr:hypothetical protein [Xanthomonadaceae bacterium]
MEGRAPQAATRPGNAARKRGRGPWVVAAIIVALVAIGLLLAFAWSGNDDTLDAYSQAPESSTGAPLADDGGAAMIVDASDNAGNETAAAPGASTPTDAAPAPAGGAPAAP